MKVVKEKNLHEKCAECKYHGVTNINGEDFDCCLVTGELVLLKDLKECPREKEKQEVKVSVEVPLEVLEKVNESIQQVHETLIKVSSTLTKVEAVFDMEDLIALIRGKTRLPLKSIRAVLDAVEKAKKVSPEHALKKFISTIGNVPMTHVSAVINEIERIREKYMRK